MNYLRTRHKTTCSATKSKRQNKINGANHHFGGKASLSPVVGREIPGGLAESFSRVCHVLRPRFELGHLGTPLVQFPLVGRHLRAQIRSVGQVLLNFIRAVFKNRRWQVWREIFARLSDSFQKLLFVIRLSALEPEDLLLLKVQVEFETRWWYVPAIHFS